MEEKEEEEPEATAMEEKAIQDKKSTENFPRNSCMRLNRRRRGYGVASRVNLSLQQSKTPSLNYS